ncbi:hypothetical protein, partial [Methylomonas fluvii]
CRFIPAGAGNATPKSAATITKAVHPRGCGERVLSGLVAVG